MKTYTITRKQIKDLQKVARIAIECADGKAQVKLGKLVNKLDVAVLSAMATMVADKYKNIKMADGNVE